MGASLRDRVGYRVAQALRRCEYKSPGNLRKQTPFLLVSLTTLMALMALVALFAVGPGGSHGPGGPHGPVSPGGS